MAVAEQLNLKVERTMTNRELTIRGLQACGWRIDDNARTKKYLAFVHPDDPRTYFVSKAGALRVSRKKGSKTSLSLTGTAVHRAYQEVGDPDYSFESVQQAIETWFRIVNPKQTHK